MPGIVLAWLAGESIIIYRAWKKTHRPPMPGQLLASSLLFAVLGVVGQVPNGKFLANAMAWGFDIAAFLQLSVTEPLTGDLNKLAASGAKGEKTTGPAPAPKKGVTLV